MPRALPVPIRRAIFQRCQSESLYNRNRYMGTEHAGQSGWVTFDPQLRAWVVAYGQGRLVRQLDAPEIISRTSLLSPSVIKKTD
jgi:hypothetical protein